MSRIAFTLAALLCAAAPAALAQPTPRPAPQQAPVRPAERFTPRQAAGAVADTIEALYFDPAKAKAVADSLRAAAAKGDFDRYADPRELAVVLGNWLDPYDEHFSVTWSADTPSPPPGGMPGPGGPGPGPGAGPQQGPPPEVLLAARRANYGIRRTEVLPGNIGYLDMRQFADIDFEDANDPARRTIDAAIAFTGGADALIIDLRDNGGGSPAMVGYLTSAFTPKGADIFNTFHNRGGTISEAPPLAFASPNLTLPVYILISGRTGSAAEAFAYTMQSAKRAVVVGEASAGAANPGGRVPVGGGYAVFVSMGSPINPITHRNWEGTGVAPDVAVPASQALTRAQSLALEGAAKGLSEPFLTENRWAAEALAPASFQADLAAYPGSYNGVSIEAHDDGLHYVRDRRPHWVLYPIAADTFAVRGDPGRRLHFQREGGRVVALEVLTPDGPSGLYRRAG